MTCLRIAAMGAYLFQGKKETCFWYSTPVEEDGWICRLMVA